MCGLTASTPSSSPTNSFICSETWGPIGHAGRRQRERDVDGPAVDLDVVDESELDEVQTQLGVDDVRERLLDFVDAWHAPSVAAAFTSPPGPSRTTPGPLGWGPWSPSRTPRPCCAARATRAGRHRDVAARRFSRALRADDDLVVELAELAFADPSLMIDLAMLARRLRRRDKALVLRSPQPQIRRADRDGRAAPPAGRAHRGPGTRARLAARPRPGPLACRGR